MKTIKIKPSSPDQGDFVVINESDFDPKVHELVEGETAPQTIAVTLTASISPELQATIDQAKAECEKAVAENAELKEQLDKECEAVKKLTAENSEQKDKLLIAEKALVAADEEIKALKAAAKKPTAAELKAAKAAEETAKAEQAKE